MERAEKPGAEALAAKGWWSANKWLVLRRVTQLAVLALFLAGPWFGVWVVKGNIASSLTLDGLPLSDPMCCCRPSPRATGRSPRP